MKINIEWNEETYNKFLNYLKSIGDEKTKEFNKKICTTSYEMLGIKMKVLKEIAKDISKTNYKKFLANTTSTYYEEVFIEGFVISSIKDPNEFLEYFNRFIYKIDCWALCDSSIASFKIFKKGDYSSLAYSLILDSREYIVRVGYIILLDYYIDKEHIKDILNICTKESSYYYVNMAIAWLLSCCYVKFKDETLKLLEKKELTPFVQNKTISKIRDSYKVSKEEKELINKYKI